MADALEVQDAPLPPKKRGPYLTDDTWAWKAQTGPPCHAPGSRRFVCACGLLVRWQPRVRSVECRCGRRHYRGYMPYTIEHPEKRRPPPPPGIAAGGCPGRGGEMQSRLP